MRNALRGILTRRAKSLVGLSFLVVAAVVAVLIIWQSGGQAPPQPPQAENTHTDESVPTTAPTVGTSTDPPSGPPPTTTVSRPVQGAPARPSGPGQVPNSSSSTNPPDMPVPSDDLLKRREIPPEGVAAQAELFVGGDGGCTEWELSPPKIVAVPASPIEIPTELWLCFYGFDPSSPLTVTIRLPGGGTETHVLAPSLMPPEVPRPLAFSRLTGHPVGTYHATAQQGPRNASLDFDVIRAQQPQMLLLDPPEDELVVSMDIHLHLGGFTPNQPTTLHLYGLELPNGIPPQDKPFPYRTSFAVPIDANGEAHVTLDTKPDDPPGCYGFLSQLIVTDFPYPGICLGPPTT